ncbi:hypothetical protein IFM89_009324 [Coptis chinensis]|uniref:Uncharacterized protein n=1 Tax=Coptis chinensis TaxID=261450 RepID=A0A835IP79_9MAGN|nr:hypothetical protein IFM89_009324 [Coptis chinensis]
MEVGELSRCLELLKGLKCRVPIEEKILEKGHFRAGFEVKRRVDCLCKHGMILREAFKIVLRHNVLEYLRSKGGLGCEVGLRGMIKPSRLRFYNLYVKPYPECEEIFGRFSKDKELRPRHPVGLWKLFKPPKWLELTSLLLTSADLVFSKVSDKDLECIFTIICNLVTKSESLDEALEMAKLISAKVTQQPNDKPVLRLKILFNLYNLLVNPYGKFYVYRKALSLAVNGKVSEHIVPSFKKIDSFLREWNVRTLDQRERFLTISNILKENRSSAKDSFYFLTKYLATFSGEDVHAIGEAKEEAVSYCRVCKGT